MKQKKTTAAPKVNCTFADKNIINVSYRKDIKVLIPDENVSEAKFKENNRESKRMMESIFDEYYSSNEAISRIQRASIIDFLRNKKNMKMSHYVRNYAR